MSAPRVHHCHGNPVRPRPQGRLEIPAKITTFMLDLDGTLWRGGHLFPGTLPFLDGLRRSGRRRLFVTNNSSRGVFAWNRHFHARGIDSHRDEILTSGLATVKYLKSKRILERVLLLGTASLRAEFQRHGIGLARADQKPSAVVLAFDKELSYRRLQRACEALLDGAPFIATHPDPVCPTDGHPVPDCGAMAALLSAATGKKPWVVGKPHETMALAAMDLLGQEPDTVAMVGDRLETDMAFGRNAGCFTIWINPERKPVPLGVAVPDLVIRGIEELAACYAP